ncbi:thermonuclease family protein [Lederbergia lenta]|uniref:Thermonuclease n=1 Tax=Lederbergia lenta TaxID=1467 RepID=A0A2X4Z8L6_LEDLE|nr:thermonuclease family protein [Lederbergia lenta]MCM3110376.1 thermonuclease family protein [Lederbergia lenta]MEC2324058.1 thermonuclease family protein [Lederbergia lenta]SQI60725.1 thermonuclease [Lederbergia lenta]
MFGKYSTNKGFLYARSIYLTFILMMGLLLAACAGDIETNGKQIDQDKKQTEGEQLFTPKMKINSSINDDNLKIIGETNLPDETILLLALESSNNERTEIVVTVKSGKFSTDSIPVEELKSGKQLIKASLVDEQPDPVINIIGENGKWLTGSLINEDQKFLLTVSIDVPELKDDSINGIKTKVKRVVDGDTIKVTMDGKEETVRLILVDTPETKHPQMGIQPFGPEASDFTTKTLDGQEVTLEVGIEERDRYGRLLAYVWIGDKLFNNMLLEKGLARVAVFPPNTKYLDQFNSTQDKAKEKAIGIWSIENYVTDKGYKEKDENNKSAASTSSNQKKSENIVAPKQSTEPATKSIEKSKSETKTAPPSTPKPAPAPKPTSDPPVEVATNCEGQIKGSNNGIYHTPGSTYYSRTTNVAQWFCSPEEAEKAGYRAPKR